MGMTRTAGPVNSRKNFDFPDKTVQQLHDLELFLQASSTSEVIRRILRAFRQILDKLDDPDLKKFAETAKQFSVTDRGVQRGNFEFSPSTSADLSHARSFLESASDKDVLTTLTNFFHNLLPGELPHSNLLEVRLNEKMTVILFG